MKLTTPEREVLVSMMIKEELPRTGKHNRLSLSHVKAHASLIKKGIIEKVDAAWYLYIYPACTIQELLAKTVKKETFHNISVYDDLIKGTYNYPLFEYVIEEDRHNEVWELTINSTSLSELDGAEEGIVGDYSYLTRAEAEADIQALINTNVSDFIQG
jgi:hypothetical protein